MLILLVPVIVACGGDDATPTPTPRSVATPPPAVNTPSVQSPFNNASPEASPVGTAPILDPATPLVPGPATPIATPTQARNLTPAELVKYQPNEIGSIPIFMYHNIVSDPKLEGHLYRTVDEFYNDLQWLYDHNFYLVGMNDVVRGTIDAPPGKHPAVLTFDDSSSMHLSFEFGPDGQPLRDENGDFVISPDCAVGIIERFAKDHPDFGATAHFSTIPVFKFSWPEYEQDEWYEEKVQWLVANDYEIGNHTSDHQDMTQLSDEDFARNIAEPYIWISEMVDPNDPNFAMRVLTLPYGAYPEGGWTGLKLEYLVNSFVWDGNEINVEGVMLVCCGTSPSRFNTEYSKLWIPRIRGDDPDFVRLQEEIEKGWIILYTSDGNPETITVPWPLPEYHWGKLDVEGVTNSGFTLVKYHPKTGKIYKALGPQDRRAYTCREQSHASA